MRPFRLSAFAALLALLAFVGDHGLIQFHHLYEMKKGLEIENQHLQTKNRELAQEIDQLKDSTYLERLIRGELGYVGKNEVVFEFAKPE